MFEQSGRPRHRRRRRRAAAALITITVIVALASAVAALIEAFPRHHQRAIREPAKSLPEAKRNDAAAATVRPRPVFRHSVVAGGVYSAEELSDAARRDPVVGRHYQVIMAGNVRTEIVAAERLAYMSYRRGSQIYWTSRKVRLPPGETILTDGVSDVRSRCGNRLSSVPMEPTADDEPTEAELDGPPSVPKLLISWPFDQSDVPSTPQWLDTGPRGVTASIPYFLPVPFDPGSVPVADFFSESPDGGSSERSIEANIPPGTSIFGGEPHLPVQSGAGGTLTLGIPLVPPAPGLLTEDPLEFDPDQPSADTPIDPVPAPEPGTVLLVTTGLSLMLRRRHAGSKRSLQNVPDLVSPLQRTHGVAENVIRD